MEYTLRASTYLHDEDDNGSNMEEAVIPYRLGQYPETERAIAAAAADGVRHVVLDLDGITELDIAGVRSLIELLRRARAKGVDLTLAIDRPEVRATLEGMALDRIFPIVTREAA
jgi:anti-anti-sigma factor